MGLLGRMADAWSVLVGAAGASLQATNSQLQESYLLADPLDDRTWNDWSARGQRYRLLWACYENTQYANAHTWSLNYRRAFELYAHTRAVFNPANAVGEFQARHLMAGRLDKKAGDGTTAPSALPIITDNQALRPPIAKLWHDSNWGARKTVWNRYGATMGDAVLRVHDDPVRKRLTLCVERPHVIKYLERDDAGNIKAYVKEYERPDPDFILTSAGSSPPYVTYTEIAQRRQGMVHYATYKGGSLYDWGDYSDGTPALGPEWDVPYDFIPMVLVQHIDAGFDWGWCEYHALLSKIREVDDLGSCTTDQIRKVLNGPWAINTKKPSTATDDKARPTAGDDYATNASSGAVQGRDQMTFKWIDKENLKVQHMVGNLDIPGVDSHVARVLDMMSRDYPELLIDSTAISGDTSGRARRYLRESAEQKIQDRRAAYDDALVRSHQMAISIGSIRAYDGYEGFTEDSYQSGDLDHEIGKRGAFSGDPFDDVELKKAKADVFLTNINAGWPFDEAMRDIGYSQEDIDRVAPKAEKLRQEANVAKQNQVAARVAGQLTGGNPPKPVGSPLMPPKNLEKNGQPSSNGTA